MVQLGMGVLAGGFLSIFWSIVKESTQPSILGLTMGLMNPAPFLGVAAFQVVTGAILDRAGESGGLYSLIGFKHAFMVCLAANLICLFLARLVRRGAPSKIVKCRHGSKPLCRHDFGLLPLFRGISSIDCFYHFLFLRGCNSFTNT
ncbi:MAG: hypothetical protein C4519_02525 [Desulfobacteraceae bacterium]|nr:MAG: hypothetical protein C4519_02525 [Desulfobacteraceae bacterium]